MRIGHSGQAPGNVAMAGIYNRLLSSAEIQRLHLDMSTRLVSLLPSYEGVAMDGLVFHLDSNNVRSYPGGGDQWTDLANGIVMTAQGGGDGCGEDLGGVPLPRADLPRVDVPEGLRRAQDRAARKACG